MSDSVIRVENLSKKYIIGNHRSSHNFRDVLAENVKSLGRKFKKPLGKESEKPRREEFWALKDINFEIKQGDRVGIIGRNGAGKSTLLKILSRITEPTKGIIAIKGRVASLLEVGTGFHPELTGRENIYLNGAILGMSKVEIKNKFDEIVAFAEVEKFLDTAVKHYSSGMYVRLAFAVAAHLDPEILIVDEVLAVGDVHFQKKCLGKMEDVGKSGRTVLFVSHNMPVVRRLCQKGIWLEGGKMGGLGTAQECVDAYVANFETFQEADLGRFDLTKRTDRGGTGKIRFKSVQLLGSDGTQKNNFEFYEPFTIQFQIECCEKVRPCFVGFSVLSAEGETLFSSHHPDSAQLRELEPGKDYTLCCSVNPNQLKPGRYLLQMGVADYVTWECYDWFYAVGLFAIEPGSGKFGVALDNRPGHTHPIFNWMWSKDNFGEM
ncbi:ABC transporter ATP-binding protein [Aerosakkonemataceae cyanobacterium BLCC-F50]|uniref:ABC transporter ATP-binding protein n=1 Tax=Floridaenema flaviceps BLCC-F50 TaxID=3153642 RepID=A0ABV4XYP8_9CYAN